MANISINPPPMGNKTRKRHKPCPLPRQSQSKQPTPQQGIGVLNTIALVLFVVFIAFLLSPAGVQS